MLVSSLLPGLAVYRSFLSCPRLFINCMDSCSEVMMQCTFETTLQGSWVTRARVVTRVARKESAVESHSHLPRYQRAPSGTSVWLQHTRGPRFRRGTIGRGT